MGTLMGTVRGVCAILPDWHSATFRHTTKIELEALMVGNYCKGGSEYSGIINFQNFDYRTNISEKYEKWPLF